MALGVVLAGSLRPFPLHVLLALLLGLVESIPLSLRELSLGVVAVGAFVSASARSLDEVVARSFRSVRGGGGDGDRGLFRRLWGIPLSVHTGHRPGGLDAILRREKFGVILLVAVLLDVSGQSAVEVLVGPLGRARFRHLVSGQGLSHLHRRLNLFPQDGFEHVMRLWLAQALDGLVPREEELLDVGVAVVLEVHEVVEVVVRSARRVQCVLLVGEKKQLTAADHHGFLRHALGGVGQDAADGTLRDLAQGGREFAVERLELAAVRHLLERSLRVLGLDDPLEGRVRAAGRRDHL